MGNESEYSVNHKVCSNCVKTIILVHLNPNNSFSKKYETNDILPKHENINFFKKELKIGSQLIKITCSF